MSTATLNNGNKIPLVGLGTWKAKPGEVGAAVKTALLEGGYRHIDCAAIYGNEKEVGEALKEVFATEGGPKRSDVFITSKLWNSEHKRADVRPALEKTLADLGLEYLDLYLIHWPIPTKKGVQGMQWDAVPLSETWAALEECVEAGLTKSIGVSNFNVQLIADLLTYAKIKPAVNQVELHPYLTQEGLIDFLTKQNVHITAYSSLGSSDSPLRKPGDPTLLDEPVIVEIAKNHNKTPAHVLLKWSEQRGNAK